MAMYHSKFVTSIKVKNKVLREFKDIVYLEFGSEYSIYLKNLNTVKAMVNVYIDGENMVPGGLVLMAGQSIDLERSIKNNNLVSGNKFKFIEFTENIENHRGSKPEDGLVRVEFQFEKPRPVINWANINIPNNVHPSPWIAGPYTGYPYVHDMMTCSNWVGSVTTSSQNSVLRASGFDNETGITVPGSKSEQKFVTTSKFDLEPETHNIILKLLGQTEQNQIVTKPVTVKHKQKCQTCGRVNKATSKFCTECGTGLELFA